MWCMSGGASGWARLPTRQCLLASSLGDNTDHRSRIGNAFPNWTVFVAKGLLQLRSGLSQKYYTAAVHAQALALVEQDFHAKASAPARLADSDSSNLRNHEVLGGDGPMRTAWRQHVADARTRDRSSLKRPRENVSHGSAVTLDRLSCVIPLEHRPRLLPRVNWSCGRTLRTWPQTRLFTATCMLLPLRAQRLPCVTVVEGQPVRVEERGGIGTPSHYRRIFRHARSTARVVQHRAAFGETQVLARLPRLAATTHLRTSGLASSGVVRLVRVRTMWHSSPRFFSDTRIC